MSQQTSNPFQVDISTVVAAGPMLGHALEDRSEIRNSQEQDLVSYIDDVSAIELFPSDAASSFVVAPLDILVSREDDHIQFHIIEMNGTGIGGVSNLPASVVQSVLASIREAVADIARPDAIVLLPVSGKEDESNPRLNKLMHEKMMFAQAIADGLADAQGQAEVITLCGLQTGKQQLCSDRPTVVIGYMKELLEACSVIPSGTLLLGGRPVVGALNDRFCLNLLNKFPTIDLDQFHPINGTYLAGGDKGIAYSLLDEHLVYLPSAVFPTRVHHAHATDPAELIATVLDWIHEGRRPVIKPHGTGIGHGIEFFLDPSESVESICKRIHDSIETTQEYYGTDEGAFPYTICEYIESDVIQAEDHQFNGHKYELRVVVYRDEKYLRACPSIAKVAPIAFDSSNPNRENLINNITNASAVHQKNGTDQMLPLCSQATLQLLEISAGELGKLCRVATRFVQQAIREIPKQRIQMQRILAGQSALPKLSSDQPKAQNPRANDDSEPQLSGRLVTAKAR
ncbi:MAG: hypothetical protein Q8M16_22165 [Pirellulaceae bacterium]|nr:hypothetical protein [Pirellulaceae bacterium]